MPPSEPSGEQVPALVEPAIAATVVESDETPHAGEGPQIRRSRKSRIPIVLLGVALVASLVTLAVFVVQLHDANTRIEEQDLEIEEQRNLIDKKETFGAAVDGLMNTASKFDGVLVSSLVPLDTYERDVVRAWNHRWNPEAMDRDIARVQTAQTRLDDLFEAATAQATTNITGSTYEAVTDQLGGGFVASVIDDADTLCEADVLACVLFDDQYTVHFDAADGAAPYMTDWLRTGVAYHEFAHVLQFASPVPTETAVEAFGGDHETMADCFALTYLTGWALDHRIWTSGYQYWDVSIGYGYTCNDAQKQAVRDWYEQLDFEMRPISQESARAAD